MTALPMYLGKLGLYGTMENKMETTISYWGYIGIILGEWKRKWKLLCYVGVILGYWKIKWKRL